MSSLNVLIVGQGADTHAIGLSILKSKMLNKLFLADCGCFNFGEVIDFSDYEDLAQKSKDKKIDLVIVNSRKLMYSGVVDAFKKYGIRCIGANGHFSKLGKSRFAAKEFLKKHEIIASDYILADENSTVNNLPLEKAPLVIKSDNGETTKITYDRNSAMTVIVRILTSSSNKGSCKILLEDYIDGDEISISSLWDGETIFSFPPVNKFKKITTETGIDVMPAMASFCPSNLTDEQLKKLEAFSNKLQNALIEEKADFKGFITSELVWSNRYGEWNWYVLELDTSINGTSCETVVTHFDSDFLALLFNASISNLSAYTKENKLVYKDGITACLVVGDSEYSAKNSQGSLISMLGDNDIKVYYQDVERRNGHLYSAGNQVLSLCTTSKTNPFDKLKSFASTILMRNKF